MDPLPSTSRAYSLLLKEEQQRSIRSFASSTSAMAFAVSSNSSKGNPTNKSRKERPMCTHCNLPGHTVDKCYKIHGYPPGYRTKQQQQRNNNAVNSVTIQNDEIAPQGTTELTSNPKINNTAEALIQCQNLLNQLQCQIKCFQSTNCLSCSRYFLFISLMDNRLWSIHSYLLLQVSFCINSTMLYINSFAKQTSF